MQKMTQKQILDLVKDLAVNDAINELQVLQEQGNNVDKLLDKYAKLKQKQDKEQARLLKMLEYENSAYNEGYSFIAGVDEAGRGPLAGPVVAAAVILPKGLLIEGVNDSKKLSEAVRDRLFDEIKQKALAYSISIVDEKCIDEINILNATKKAMREAICGLSQQADCILLDAVKLEDISTKQIPIIKGDALSLSIAAASILAKVTRDRLICELDSQYPEYGFATHKGYGTAQHISAIKKFGICPIHRLSFVKNFTNV